MSKMREIITASKSVAGLLIILHWLTSIDGTLTSNVSKTAVVSTSQLIAYSSDFKNWKQNSALKW